MKNYDVGYFVVIQKHSVDLKLLRRFVIHFTILYEISKIFRLTLSYTLLCHGSIHIILGYGGNVY